MRASRLERVAGYAPLVSIAVLSLLFLIAVFCSVPFYDDFNWYLDGRNRGAWSNTLISSQFWSSRFVSNFLGSASGSFPDLVVAYPFLLLFCSGCYYAALLRLAKSLQFVGRDLHIAASILFFSVFGLSVHVSDSYFWFSGANSYLMAATFGTLCLAEAVGPKPPKSVLLLLFPALAILSNECSLTFCIAMAVLTFVLRKGPRGKKSTAFLLAGTLGGIVAFILLPGTRARGSEVGAMSPGHLNAFLKLTVEGLALGLTVALCGSLLLLVGARMLSAGASKSLSPADVVNRLLRMILIASLTAGGSIAPSVLLAGYLPGRVEFMAVASSLALIAAFAFGDIEKHEPASTTKSNPQMLALAAVFLWALPQNLGLLRNLRENLAYSKEQRQRFSQLGQAANKGPQVLKPAVHRPETLFQDDIKPDTKNYINKNLALYFGVESVELESTSSPAR